MERTSVSIIHCNDICYPGVPFHPDQLYPELHGICNRTDGSNSVYPAVRQCLLDLRMDAEHIGTPEWSPFRDIIAPGDTVLIKPNLVKDTLEASCQDAVTTHGSVIRPVIDYCIKALAGSGKIIVGDAPTAETDFDTVAERNGLKALASYYQSIGTNLALRDFRLTKVIMEGGIWIGEQKNAASDSDFTIVNLAEKSMFYDPKYKNADFHGGGYDRRTTKQHHHDNIQEYCVSKTILEADAVISIPKLKTHKKAGLTCCMKNLVGINVNKDFLPHFVVGPANTGGDEFPELSESRIRYTRLIRKTRDLLLVKHWRLYGKWLARAARILNSSSKTHTVETHDFESPNDARSFMAKVTGTTVFQGAWPGNETMWRMILDLNRIFIYADKNGQLQKNRARKYFYVVDAVTAGGRNGPMAPSPVHCATIAAGYEALAIDWALLKAMAIDPRQIPLYRHAILHPWLGGCDAETVIYNGSKGKPEVFDIPKLAPPDHWSF